MQARAGSNEAAEPGAARRPIRELRATRRVCAREAAIYLIMSCGTCPPLAVVHRSGAGRASPDVWRGLANAPRVSNREATPVPCDQCPGVERAPHTCAARQYYVAATALAPVSLLFSSSKNWTRLRSSRSEPDRGLPSRGSSETTRRYVSSGLRRPEDSVSCGGGGACGAAADSDAESIRSAATRTTGQGDG